MNQVPSGAPGGEVSDEAPSDHPNCHTCGHLWDPHILITAIEPPMNGIIFCPEDECDCWATWSIKGTPRPDPEEIEILKRIIEQEYSKVLPTLPPL